MRREPCGVGAGAFRSYCTERLVRLPLARTSISSCRRGESMADCGRGKMGSGGYASSSSFVRAALALRPCGLLNKCSFCSRGISSAGDVPNDVWYEEVCSDQGEGMETPSAQMVCLFVSERKRKGRVEWFIQPETHPSSQKSVASIADRHCVILVGEMPVSCICDMQPIRILGFYLLDGLMAR